MKYHIEQRGKRISYVQYKEGRPTGLITSCIGTALYNKLLKERYEKE
jgi:hypothetical protein